jgi:hypothetical protein
MIPKYPFIITVWRKLGQNKLDQRAKSFETLDAAHAFASTIMRSSDVKRVQLTCVLDDTRRDEAGNVLGFDREAQS